MKPIVLSFLISFFAISSFSQIMNGAFVPGKGNVFTWGDYMFCQTGEYDTTKYTKDQIFNTFHFIYTLSSWSENKVAELPRNPGQIDSLSIRKLNKHYRKLVKRIKHIKLIDSEFWNTQKELMIKRTLESKEIQVATFKAYKNPSALLDYKGMDSCLYLSAAITTGGDSIFALWKDLTLKRCVHNSDPIKCYEYEFSTKFNSPDSLQWAKICTVREWNSCMYSHPINRYPFSEQEREFLKFFTSITAKGIE